MVFYFLVKTIAFRDEFRSWRLVGSLLWFIRFPVGGFFVCCCLPSDFSHWTPSENRAGVGKPILLP